MDRNLVRELSWVLVLKILAIMMIWQIWFSAPTQNVQQKIMTNIYQVGSVAPSLHKQEVTHDQ